MMKQFNLKKVASDEKVMRLDDIKKFRDNSRSIAGLLIIAQNNLDPNITEKYAKELIQELKNGAQFMEEMNFFFNVMVNTIEK